MKPWAKILAFLIVALASLELLWVIAANRYLKSQGFQELLQKGGLKITFEKASTALPGQLYVKTLTLESSDTRLELPEARLNFSLLALAGKRLIFWTARGQGGSFIYRPAAARASDEDQPATQRATPPPTDADSSDKDWTVHFQKLALRDLQNFVMGSLTAKGSMDISGELHLAGEDQVRIQNGRLQVRAVETLWKDQSMARIDQLQGRFELEPFHVKDDLLRKLTLDLSGEAELKQGELLQNVIVDAPWLRIKGLDLKSKGRVFMKQGQLMDPTQLSFQSPNLQLELWKETVTGHGSLNLTVDEAVKLHFSIPQFTVDHESKGQIDVSGRDLSLRLMAEDRDLLSRDRAWQAALELPESTIHDLRYFNHFLPQGLGFQFKAGQGKVQLHLDSAVTRGNYIRLEAPEALVAYEKQEFFGRLQQELNIDAIDFVQEGFTVPTGELTLHVRPGGRDSEAKAWAGQLSLRQGRVALTPSRFEGMLKLKADDLRPLLWIFDPQSKLPDWSRQLFLKEQLEAQFHLKADENSYAIDHFRAETDALKMDAWYQGSQERKRGKLLLRYGGLSAGIAVTDDDFKVQLLSSKEWLQNRQ
jgi:hypothetical protein